MGDINEHIANLASETNKAISKYARLDMCKIKNILVGDDGHLIYIEPPEKLYKECESQKHKIEVLLEEIADAVKKRDGIEEGEEIKGDSFFENE